MIRQLPGLVGYVELIYAVQNKIPYGSVKNSSGQYIKASLESTTAAAAGVKMPADFRVSITNSPAKNGISHCELHLAAGADQSDGCQQRQDLEGFSFLDARTRPIHDRSTFLRSAASGSDRDGKGGDHKADPLNRAEPGTPASSGCRRLVRLWWAAFRTS